MITRTRALVGAAALLALGGCTGPAPAPPPGPPPPSTPADTGLPPRPMTLKIEGIDPCELLSAEQRRRLGVVQSGYLGEGGDLRGLTCYWVEEGINRPEESWGGSLLTSPGAEFALGVDPLRTVQGFATTSTKPIASDPRWYCTMFVDIAPGQSLGTYYGNATHDVPGMTHEQACAKAQQLAEYMLTALKARQSG